MHWLCPHFLSLFTLCAVSFSMLTEPVVGVFLDAPDQLWTDTDAEADDNDDDPEDDSFLPAAPAEPNDSFVLECRVTLLSDDTRSSRNLDGDPRGPPGC